MQAKRFLAVNLNLFDGLIHAKSKVKTNSIFFSIEFLKAKQAKVKDSAKIRGVISCLTAERKKK